MNVGDAVYYAPDPLLYGEMEFRGDCAHRGCLCLVQPDGDPQDSNVRDRPYSERFDPTELTTKAPSAVSG
jgi:hypothetical protein